MYEMHETSIRHTITLNDTTFEKLRDRGRFGESYSKLISRLLDQLEIMKKEENVEVE
jgi:predicted CopG family antitoxin